MLIAEPSHIRRLPIVFKIRRFLDWKLIYMMESVNNKYLKNLTMFLDDHKI